MSIVNIKKTSNFISGDLVKVVEGVSFLFLQHDDSLGRFFEKKKNEKKIKISPGEIGIILKIKKEGSLKEFLLLFGTKIGWTSQIFLLEKW